MASRDHFSRYVYKLHEMVNKLLKKKSGLSYCDVRERYEHFRSRCTDEKPKICDIKAYEKEETNKSKNKTLKKGTKEKGCTEPLYGKKSNVLLKLSHKTRNVKRCKLIKSVLKKDNDNNN